MTDQENVDFGYRQVPPEEKERLVRGVFDRVAGRYDLMNDLMSLGLHRLWKNEMIARLAPHPAMRLLDVAGGTGDIAFRFLTAGGGHVTVCDINENMLREGRDRALDRNLPGIGWACANAESLPFGDMTQDAYTIAFGIRNVTDIPKALREARRVLRPGGRLLCLEFAPPADEGLFARLYDLYSFHVIPAIGQAVAGDGTPYRYLVESIRRFPPPERFGAMIEEAGLAVMRWKPLSGGIVALHSARRI